MTLQTHVDQALDRVQSEQTHVNEKQAGYDTFERTVRELPTGSPGNQGTVAQSATGEALTASASLLSVQSSQNHCREVREAFAETIRPYSVEDADEPESLLETISEELGDDVAVALAPQTGGQFTAQTKQAVLSAITERRDELAVMEQRLETEEQSLQAANERVTTIIDWLCEANETPLTDVEFDELQARHETLADHRTRCDQIAVDRQEVLDETTSRDGSVAIQHRTLVDYLYDELAFDYPVLGTCTRLDSVCADCQRVVRDHLVRRV
jgi:hypothetical protein